MFDPAPTSAGGARRFVTAVLGSWGTEAARDVVELLISEVVTNAILHARTEIHVSVRLLGDRITVEVADASSDPPVRRMASEEATSGRGLELVAALAERWGVERVPADGKVVWFEVTA